MFHKNIFRKIEKLHHHVESKAQFAFNKIALIQHFSPRKKNSKNLKSHAICVFLRTEKNSVADVS